MIVDSCCCATTRLHQSEMKLDDDCYEMFVQVINVVDGMGDVV